MTAERMPPQDISMEQSVLGAMLLDRDAALTAIGLLAPTDFYRGPHNAIFSAARDVLRAEDALDFRLLGAALTARGELETVGGIGYLVKLLDGCPTSAHVEQYARVVKEKAQLRAIIAAATAAVRSAYEPGRVSYDILDEVSDALLAVGEGNAAARPVSDSIAEFRAWLDSGAPPGIKCGLEPIDSAMSGLRPGTFIVIGARPSHGKSITGLRLAMNMASDDCPVFLASLEMSEMELTNQMTWLSCGVDCIRENLTTTRRGMADKALANIERMPIMLDDHSVSLFQVTAAIRAAALRGKASVAIIDYIQLIEAPEKESRQVTVSAISRACKHLARAARIPVIAMAQLNRESERAGIPPRLSNLRESGSLEQDADAVILLHRPHHSRPMKEGGDDGIMAVNLAKNRMGPLARETYRVGMDGQFKLQEKFRQGAPEDDGGGEIPF